MLEKVLERLATSEDTTLVIKREYGGKMRVTSRHWEDAKVVFARRGAGGPQRRWPAARCTQERKPDEWDSPVEPYDLYEPNNRSSMSDTSRADVTRYSSVSDYRP